MTGKRLTKPTPCQALRDKLERVEHELREAKARAKDLEDKAWKAAGLLAEASVKLNEYERQIAANANSYDGLLAHLHETEAKLEHYRNMTGVVEIHV